MLFSHGWAESVDPHLDDGRLHFSSVSDVEPEVRFRHARAVHLGWHGEVAGTLFPSLQVGWY